MCTFKVFHEVGLVNLLGKPPEGGGGAKGEVPCGDMVEKLDEKIYIQSIYAYCVKDCL